VYLTVPELGVLLLLLFGVCHYLHILAKTRAVLAFLGTVAVGLTGVVGRVSADLATWAQHAVGAVTAWAFGASLSVGLFVLVILLVHDLHPKKSASGRTGYLAIAVGILLAAGVSQLPALAPLANGIRSFLASIAAYIDTL
jgi:hypothetical protein